MSSGAATAERAGAALFHVDDYECEVVVKRPFAEVCRFAPQCFEHVDWR